MVEFSSFSDDIFIFICVYVMGIMVGAKEEIHYLLVWEESFVSDIFPFTWCPLLYRNLTSKSHG